LSCAIAEKSLVKDDVLMLVPPPDVLDPAAVVADAAPVVADELDLELLLHAASPAAPMTTAVSALTLLSDPLMVPPVLSSACARGRDSRRVPSAVASLRFLPRSAVP
jgi:hypothetical protein